MLNARIVARTMTTAKLANASAGASIIRQKTAPKNKRQLFPTMKGGRRQTNAPINPTVDKQRATLIKELGKLDVSFAEQMASIRIALAGMEAGKNKEEITQKIKAFLATCKSK